MEVNWGTLPQQLVYGIQLGAVYALIALGYRGREPRRRPRRPLADLIVLDD